MPTRRSTYGAPVLIAALLAAGCLAERITAPDHSQPADRLIVAPEISAALLAAIDDARERVLPALSKDYDTGNLAGSFRELSRAIRASDAFQIRYWHARAIVDVGELEAASASSRDALIELSVIRLTLDATRSVNSKP
jgi:hypothetical protein